MLKKYNISLKQFKDFVKAEKISLNEMADVDYMNDKMIIWRDIIEDNLLHDNLLEYFEKDEIPMIARYVMRNKLSISEIVWEEENKWGNDIVKKTISQEKWLALADHIIGYCQENLKYEE